MKKVISLKFIVFVLVMMLASCEELTPDLTSDNDQIENIQTQISNSMVINQATKVNGETPYANGNFSLSVSSASVIANENGRFVVQFETESNFKGIYLQVKGAYNYHNIPSNRVQELRITENDINNNERFETKNYELMVSFITPPPVTSFCYTISSYDENGNISAPQEFCVTVAAWGGLPNLVGNWKYIKEETYVNDILANTNSQLNGELLENVNTGFDHCSTNSNEIATVVSSAWLEIKANGEYLDNYHYGIEQITPNCGQQDFLDVFKGNWSYNASTNFITLINFEENENTLNFPNHPNYHNSFPNGDIYIVGTIQVLNDASFVIKDYEDNGYILYHFEKF